MWIYWSTRDLQHESEIKTYLLSDVIPALEQSEAASNFISTKSKLASLVESLQDHDYFRKKSNLKNAYFVFLQKKWPNYEHH